MIQTQFDAEQAAVVVAAVPATAKANLDAHNSINGDELNGQVTSCSMTQTDPTQLAGLLVDLSTCVGFSAAVVVPYLEDDPDNGACSIADRSALALAE